MEELRRLYDNGLPFPSDFKEEIILPLIEDLKRRPSMLIIDGAPGTGKTTLGVHIVDLINGFPMDLVDNKQLAMGGPDLMIKAEDCRKAKLKVILYDEADLDKRGSLTRFNSNLMGFFREYRSMEILIILIIQNVSWLDSRIFDVGLVEGLVHLYDPQDGYTRYSVYDLENLSYLLFNMVRMGMQKRKAYSITHGYKRGQFLNLPPERAAQLEKISNSQKRESRKKRIKNTISIVKGKSGGK